MIQLTWPEPNNFDDYEEPAFYAEGSPDREVAERIAANRASGSALAEALAAFVAE